MTKRTSNERFVIYVKKGLYRENIEVGINVNNIIMLVAAVLEGLHHLQLSHYR